MKNDFRNSNSILLWQILLSCAFILVAHTQAAATTTSPVQVQMGSNHPVGRILSLELTVNSIQLVSPIGAPVSLLSSPFTVEQSHLTASAEVVGRINIPTRIYSKALITASNPHVIFLDDYGNVREARWFGTSLTTVILKQPITITTAASVLSISLNMASLMNFDSFHQTMLRNKPTFTVAQLSPTHRSADAQVASELEPTIGRVTNATVSSFTVADSVSGLTTTYLTDRDTAFNGLSLHTMTHLLVRIHSNIRDDGQLLAQEVSVAGSGAGAIVTGIITDYAGTKVTAQQVYGAGANSSALGAAGTVTLDATSTFEVESRGMDLAGLNVTFSPANMVPGQRIQFLSRAAIQNSSSLGTTLPHALTARLQLQSISGIVASVSPASNGGTSFDLLLPVNDGSPLTSLGEGTGIVHVVTQPLTKSSLILSEGLKVKVRGLLLFDSSPLESQRDSPKEHVATRKGLSNYYMVAHTIQRDGGR